MNKAELIEAAAKKAEATQIVTEKVLNAIIDVVQETVAKRDDVVLVGFGTFKAVDRAARSGRNPQTGESLQIPAKVIPDFKAGATFKDVVKEANPNTAATKSADKKKKK